MVAILSTSSRNNRLNLGIGGIKGQMVTMRQPEIHLWRAVDSEGNVLDILTYGDFLDCHHFMGCQSFVQAQWSLPQHQDASALVPGESQ